LIGVASGRCTLPGEPEVYGMLSREDNRRLSQLERQLQREDPEFCYRMAEVGKPARRRPPIAMVFVALVIWVSALVLGVAGWWIPAACAGLWATAIVGWVVFRSRPRRPIHPMSGPEPAPPSW
jgi:hypothetical protein